MKRERGIWQRRHWEYQIRDDDDLAKHVDYVHINPVKHGYVKRAADWPYSSIHREIARGNLNWDWGCSNEDDAGKWGE
jgi:putative transposase